MEYTLSKQQAQKAAAWLKNNFEEVIKAGIAGTPWTVDLVCAIACQETAYKWLLWIDKYPADVVLQRCVFDASGDLPGTGRSAFPKNRADFEDKYGKDLAAMLVNEGNKQRAMPQVDAPGGYKPAGFLYKGYGIFQNDLQNIVTDRAFFQEKKWYNMTDCLAHLVQELNGKARKQSTLEKIVQAYNGSGPRAEAYAANVMQFREWVA
ncbi:hypothetical protein [Deminuibacter soli]|uniref:Transglycosylase SLT domain-containing protein n=1 Tax=Deminuibacter soli TaxID=2291815 RepID=A0A3E1NQ10_9BACT|nr:hypothetical protein [Deminuibacter soli]RFM30016.1 hypothetical protein DXN05_03325 [Deminuibacter soli]